MRCADTVRPSIPWCESLYTGRVLFAPLGFTPYLSHIQTFPNDAYDEERGQFLASGTQEYRSTKSTSGPQRCTVCGIDIRERLQCLLLLSLMFLDQWLIPSCRRVAQR